MRKITCLIALTIFAVTGCIVARGAANDGPSTEAAVLAFEVSGTPLPSSSGN